MQFINYDRWNDSQGRVYRQDGTLNYLVGKISRKEASRCRKLLQGHGRAIQTIMNDYEK